MEWLNFALILQIFVLLNPLSSFPFLMNAYKKKLNVKKIAFSAVLTAFIIAVAIIFIGPYMFNLFGVTLNSFRIAGGIVLLLLGINTVRPKDNGIKEVGGVNSLISIIATPMLTGPATISFLTIQSYEFGHTALLLNTVIAFILVGVLFITFSFLIPRVNVGLINISSRVLGLFLTAVAIEMIAKGASWFLAK